MSIPAAIFTTMWIFAALALISAATATALTDGRHYHDDPAPTWWRRVATISVVLAVICALAATWTAVIL